MDDTRRLDEQLQQLHLHYIRSHYQEQANKAAEHQHPHVRYLGQLIEGEATERENRAIQRRIANARFPNVGLSKTHLSIALGHTACLKGHSVLFSTAVDIINTW